MKNLVIFISIFLLHAKMSEGATEAKCVFSERYGDVIFREQDDQLSFKVELHNLPASNGFKIHVHENPKGETCADIGHHYDPTYDAGNITPSSFRSKEDGHLHTDYAPVRDLSLTGEYKIIGRSVALHFPEDVHLDKICCNIILSEEE